MYGREFPKLENDNAVIEFPSSHTRMISLS